MAILNSLFTWIMKKRIHQIELFMKYPHDVQEEWFQNLISTAEATEWGKKYDYKSIYTVADYKSRVPISDYDDTKGYIDRMIKGEQISSGHLTSNGLQSRRAPHPTAANLSP
jgi:hypothetical protein